MTTVWLDYETRRDGRGFSTKDISAFLQLVSNSDTEECIEWPFGKDSDGYGKCRRFGYRLATHAVLHLKGFPRPSGQQALHSCDNPPCVNPRHLRWGTHQDNMSDRNLRNRHQGVNLGEKHGQSVLTEDLVRKLRRSYASGNFTFRELANEHGFGPMTVYRAVTGRTWGHVK